MNDYRFGNFICEKRTMAGLSQQQMAGLLKVSDKTVSKWENGKAKPRPDVLKKIAVLFDVSVEELLQESTLPRFRFSIRAFCSFSVRRPLRGDGERQDPLSFVGAKRKRFLDSERKGAWRHRRRCLQILPARKL